ncbi:hypothetical protein ACFX16_005853 [Malus domestica]
MIYDFQEDGFQGLMLRDEAERYDELLNMGKMKPACDISIEDSLRYVTRFGIPFEERWPLGTNRSEGDNWGQQGFPYVDINSLFTVFYPIIIPPELAR